MTTSIAQQVNHLDTTNRLQETLLQSYWAGWSAELRETVNILLDVQNVRVGQGNVGTARAALEGGAPTITVDPGLFKEIFDRGTDAYPLFKGLIYHELSHLMWSPLKSTSAQFIRGYWSVLEEARTRVRNQDGGAGVEVLDFIAAALEDNRIELMTAKLWRPMTKFFSITNLTLLYEYMAQDDDSPQALDWLLFSYRAGIPDAAKAAARAKWDERFGRSELAEKIMASYMLLVDLDASSLIAVAAIEKLYELTRDPQDGGGPCNLLQDASAPPEATGSGGGLGLHDGSAPSVDRDDLDEAAGDQAVPEAGLDIDDLRAEVEEKLEQAEGDKEIRADTQRTANSVKSRASKGADLSESMLDARGSMRPVTAEMAAAKRRLSEFFRRLRHGIDDEWVTDTSGKINGLRYGTRGLRPGNFDYFKTFEHGGEQAGSSHMVIAIDCSGSMSTVDITLASQAAWVIEQSALEIGAFVETMLFNTEVAYGTTAMASAHTYKQFQSRGGTLAKKPLAKALEALSTSPARNRFFIMLTDGAVQDPIDTKDGFLRLKAANVTTAHVGIDKAVSTYGSHGAAIAHDITNPSGLIPLAQQLIGAALVNARKYR